MDMMTLINTRLSPIKSTAQKSSDETIESLNTIDRSKQYKKVAEEMESLFAYQLLKTMRETANSLTEDTKSNGHDTYMSMFDIEISKLFAKRGMGLQDSIINWLERMPVSTNGNNKIVKND
jgi:Rod binding domain-containing protein